jgi:hypothetical protein
MIALTSPFNIPLVFGISHRTIGNRLARGWSVERALLTKQGKGSNQYAHKPRTPV